MLAPPPTRNPGSVTHCEQNQYIGASRWTKGTHAPSQSNYLHFHAVFGKKDAKYFSPSLVGVPFFEILDVPLKGSLRIGGSKEGDAMGAPPPSVQFLSFSSSFWDISCQIIGFCPQTQGLVPPCLEVPGSATALPCPESLGTSEIDVFAACWRAFCS